MSRNFLVPFALCHFATASFGNTRCDKQATKASAEACYKQSVAEKREALDEFHESIMASPKIPFNVKAQVEEDYRSFMRNIFSFCPDIACVGRAMMEQIRDMHKETGPYTIPQ